MHNEALLFRDDQSEEGLRRRSISGVAGRVRTHRPRQRRAQGAPISRHQSQRQGAGTRRRRCQALGVQRHHGLSRPGRRLRPVAEGRRSADRGDAVAELECENTSHATPARSTSSTSSSPHSCGGAPDPKAVEEATGFFKQFAAVLNDHLRGRKFLLGDTPTDRRLRRGRHATLRGQGQDTGCRLLRDRALARTA